MALLHDYGLSYPEIGRTFERCHTTVLQGAKKHRSTIHKVLEKGSKS